MDLKNLLKNLKMHESTISTVFGFLVIVVVGLLVVNYFRNLDTGSTLPTGATAEEENSNESGKYIVKEGESLWTIAEDYYGSGFEWTRVAEANNIADPNDIEDGQELIMPAREDEQLAGAEATQTVEPTLIAVATPEASLDPTLEPTPEVTAEPTIEPAQPEVASEQTISGGTYTVVHGDNLWDIAVAAYGDGYRWTDIASANDLVNPSVIHAGNVFVIPR